MTKQDLQNLKILIYSELDKIEAAEISQPKESAKKWLEKLLSTLTAKLKNGNIVWRNDKQEWMFEQYEKNGKLYYSYNRVWMILNKQFNMQHDDINSLIKDVVCEAYNCKHLTPKLPIQTLIQ